MDRKKKEKFLFLLILIKKLQMQRDDTNVSFNQVLEYLNEILFRNDNATKTKLLSFLKGNNHSQIVNYLWTKAIMK